MYKVIEHFTDLQDDRYEYNPGDEYPRVGLEVSPARIEELSTDKNRRHRPMIKPIEEPESKIREDFINPPVIADKSAEEPVKPKRGRKKKTDVN